MSEQDDDKPYWFSTQQHLSKSAEPGIWLRLQQFMPPDAIRDRAFRPPVLLLHGGSANHRTFTIETVGLADWLFALGLDPWLLDWRGSSLVVDFPLNQETLKRRSELYTFNRAAREDLPAAIAIMRSQGVTGAIAAVGHCMGAAVIAEAIATGSTGKDINRIVLLALGLFYQAAIDSRLKSEERVLERLTSDVANVPVIDPRMDAAGKLPQKPWPSDLERLYMAWPSGLRAHDDQDPSVSQMCNRVSFMYGMPFYHQNLAPGIHEAAPKHQGTGSVGPELPRCFGGFPLKMYLHAARNLRAGQATFFDSGSGIATEASREKFLELESVTLITGELNRLWHRDSIDRMHEWLCRGFTQANRFVRKFVLKDFAHQDLLWSGKSPVHVYPRIAEGLGLHTVAADPSRQRRRRRSAAYRTDPESSASAF